MGAGSSYPRRWVTLVALSAAASVIGVAAPAGSAPRESARLRENSVLWYQDDRGAEAWGDAARVVTIHADPAVVHANGSEAWKYGQVSWFPDARPTWNGLTRAQRVPLRLCRAGAPNGVGDRNRHAPDLWYWADYNERAFSDAMVAWAQSVKALGWDGLFLDTAGYTFNGPERATVSTCTTDPIQPGITQRAAYVNMLRRIHRVTGLRIALNNPPNDVIDDHLGTWLAWFMRENMGSPRTPSEVTLMHAVHDARLPFGSALEMGKSLLPPGAPGKSAQELYTWGRAKLAGQPVAVNTGSDQCPNGAPLDYCLRMGVPTSLVNVRLGRALGTVEMHDCDRRAGMCILVRRFQDGFVAVNMGRRTRSLELHLAACRVMFRERAGLLNGGACVQDLVASIGAQRAWVVTYR